MSQIKAFCEICKKITICCDDIFQPDFYCMECDYFVPTTGKEPLIDIVGEL